jgi:hypothetical protein
MTVYTRVKTSDLIKKLNGLGMWKAKNMVQYASDNTKDASKTHT